MATKVRKALATKEVKRAIRKLEPEVVKEVLEAEAEKAERKIGAVTRRPGMTVEGGKIPWTYSDMERFPTVELHSEENVIITWNGLRYQLYQGGIHYVPDVIAREYYRHRHEPISQLKRVEAGFDPSFITTIAPGAGPLPPE